MTVGIPRAFLYWRYRVMWETFFKHLGVETVYSEPTTRETVRRGAALSIDESCLSSKIHLGHIENLKGRCDYILVPRLGEFGYNKLVCTKFQAAYDVVKSVFKDGVNIIDYNIDYPRKRREMKAFILLARSLGKPRSAALLAYLAAKKAEREEFTRAAAKQEAVLNGGNLKILVVGHPYNTYDAYAGEPVIKLLGEQGADVITADVVDRKAALKAYKSISPGLKWVFSRELVGAVALYKERVDGIILLTAFPCGPDSLVNEIILRKVKDKPIITLVLDEQDGTAGKETRVESFIDIIKFKKEEIK